MSKHRLSHARRMSHVARRTSHHVACRSIDCRTRVACRMSLVAPANMSHVEASIVATASRVTRSFSLWGNHPRPPPNEYNASFGKKSVTNAHATFLATFDDLEVIKCKDDATFLCESNGISFTGMDGGEGSRRPSERWLPFLRASWPSRRSALPRPIVPLPPGMAAAKGLAALPDDGSLSYGHLGRADALLSLDESRRSFGRRRKRPKV